MGIETGTAVPHAIVVRAEISGAELSIEVVAGRIHNIGDLRAQIVHLALAGQCERPIRTLVDSLEAAADSGLLHGLGPSRLLLFVGALADRAG